jgi:hypothetical protein
MRPRWSLRLREVWGRAGWSLVTVDRQWVPIHVGGQTDERN